MRAFEDCFHLAIPAFDLDEAEEFYSGGLDCKRARRYEDRVTFDFFGDQLVCHLSERPVGEPAPLELYPRHFGVTFAARRDFEAVLETARSRGLPFFLEPFERFSGRPEVHRAFVLRDPSDNLVEFKHYADPAMMH
jgi:extradiol dioxygenase family protein